MRGLTSWIESVRRRLFGEPRLRDPHLDFGVAPTDPRALAAAPVYRGLPGPYLSEHATFLSLHLGGSTADGVHAIMDKSAPTDLVFSYTRIMAGFSRFHPKPRTIGMLGLGGGSLAKHCYREHQDSSIVVAEISAEVIALRHLFHIPDDDARFSILNTEGSKLVEQSRGRFDVLLIDAFDEAGQVPHLSTRAFYRDCYRALAPAGVLVLNFSGEAWKTALRRLNGVFQGRSVLYCCPDGDNTIAFATKGPLPAWLRP